MKPSHGAPEQYHNETRAAIGHRQRGVTGLETAIILLAFVVVASIYAFTVLSTGIFSADQGKETIHAGLGEASDPAELGALPSGWAPQMLPGPPESPFRPPSLPPLAATRPTLPPTPSIRKRMSPSQLPPPSIS